MLLIDHEFTENCHDRRVVIIIIHVLKIICYILLNLIRMSQINFYEHRFIMNCRINWHLIWACLLLWLSHEHLIWLLPVLWRPVFRGIKMRCGGESLEGENLHTVQNSPLGPDVHTVDFCCLGVDSKPLIGADCHRSQHHETAKNLSQTATWATPLTSTWGWSVWSWLFCNTFVIKVGALTSFITQEIIDHSVLNFFPVWLLRKG